MRGQDRGDPPARLDVEPFADEIRGEYDARGAQTQFDPRGPRNPAERFVVLSPACKNVFDRGRRLLVVE